MSKRKWIEPAIGYAAKSRDRMVGSKKARKTTAAHVRGH